MSLKKLPYSPNPPVANPRTSFWLSPLQFLPRTLRAGTLHPVTRLLKKWHDPLPDKAHCELWWIQADSCSFMPIRVVFLDYVGFTLLEVIHEIEFISVWR